MWQKVVLIAAAGALGTISRYGLSTVAQRAYTGALPVGSLATNIVGCFLFGLAWALGEERAVLTAESRSVVLIGFMGAFTTFSTYIFESEQLIRDSAWILLAGHLLIQNILGIICLVLGVSLARWL